MDRSRQQCARRALTPGRWRRIKKDSHLDMGFRRRNAYLASLSRHTAPQEGRLPPRSSGWHPNCPRSRRELLEHLPPGSLQLWHFQSSRYAHIPPLHARVPLPLTTFFRRSVLPPVPTEGLTTADVGDLATRVHGLMLETLREISDPNAPPPPGAPAQAVSMSQSEKENPVVGPSTPKEATPVPFAGDADVPQPRNVPEERPETPHSEVTSEGSIRRSEGDTEEEEGMVLVGRPR